MDLGTFKRIHGDNSLPQKLFMFVKLMEKHSDCRVNYLEAKRHGNEEAEERFQKEMKELDDRGKWLYSELWEALEKMENDWR